MAPPPLPVIKIVKYCDVWGGGAGRRNPTKIMASPLSVIKIVKYCSVVRGGGGALVVLKSYKHNGAQSLSLRLLSIVASGERGALGGAKILLHWRSAKILQKIMVPPLSVIKINKYCGVRGGGH